MNRHSRPTWDDRFTRGRYDCMFRCVPESNSWTVEVVDAQTGALIFETTPVTSQFEAYQLAINWLDCLEDDARLEALLARYDIAVEAEAGVLHVTRVAAMADVA